MTTSVHVMNLGPGILRCRGVTLMESESETFAVWGNGSQLVVEEIKSHGGQLETPGKLDIHTDKPADPSSEFGVPCCGQYDSCVRACTPRGEHLGYQHALREIGRAEPPPPPEQPHSGKIWYATDPPAPPARNKLPSALQIGDHARIEGIVTGVHFENGKVIYVIETGTGQSYIADSCDVCYGAPK